MQSLIEQINQGFIELFHKIPSYFFQSPGRAEIIGNHTDHNGGCALVTTVDLSMVAAVNKRRDSKINVFSKGFSFFQVDILNLEVLRDEKKTSIALLKGVADLFLKSGYEIGGLDVYIESMIPIGSGLSSSAAFECLFAQIFNVVFNNGQVQNKELVHIAHRAECEYFGKDCGLLDQTAIIYGGFLLLDFLDEEEPNINTLEVSIEPYEMVIVQTGKDHQSLTQHYESIPNEMKKVANYFKKNRLIDLNENQFIESISSMKKEGISDRAILRSLHFYNENQRVKRAVGHLKTKQIDLFLEEISASNISSLSYLQNHYVPGDTSQGIPLALAFTNLYVNNGSCRVHGGGFEGTIISFIHRDEKDDYCNKMRDIFGKESVYCISSTSKGTHVMQWGRFPLHYHCIIDKLNTILLIFE